MAHGIANSGERSYEALGICVIASAAGYISGYEIGILGGGGVASMPNFLKKFFPAQYNKEVINNHVDKETDQFCKFNNVELNLFTSSFYIAALCASLVAWKVSRKLGAKWSMVLGGSLFVVGSIVGAAASKVFMLISGQVLVGFGIGLTNQAATVYLLEMATYKLRWASILLFQFSISVGIVLANVANNLTNKMENDNGWRLSLGLPAVPALIFNILGLIVLPDMPTSLIECGKHKEAKDVLMKIRDDTEEVDREFNDMVAASIESEKIKDPWHELLKRKYRPHLMLMTLLPFFQQLVGVNGFMFHDRVLFKTMDTTFGDEVPWMFAMMSSSLIGDGVIVATLLVSEFGRRKLFIVGGVLMFLSQIFINICTALKLGLDGNPGDFPAWYVVTAMCVYALAFACTWGPLGWLVPNEILPLEIRSVGASFNVCTYMIYTFFGTKIFLNMICKMKFEMLIFFSIFGFFMTPFVYYWVPETKTVQIADTQGIWKAHPIWKKYVCDELSYQKMDIEMST